MVANCGRLDSAAASTSLVLPSAGRVSAAATIWRRVVGVGENRVELVLVGRTMVAGRTSGSSVGSLSGSTGREVASITITGDAVGEGGSLVGGTVGGKVGSVVGSDGVTVGVLVAGMVGSSGVTVGVLVAGIVGGRGVTVAGSGTLVGVAVDRVATPSGDGDGVGALLVAGGGATLAGDWSSIMSGTAIDIISGR